jgi:hypothetical protein
MIIPENNKNQMKSTRLHLAKGIKLIQRLQSASLDFCFASSKGSRVQEFKTSFALVQEFKTL